MKYRSLGGTDMMVSAVAMGCWPLAGDFVWGPQRERDSLATVQCALDRGVNFFDTAEGYGDGCSEQVLGKALAGCRDRVVIATKVSPSHFSADEMEKACERSLQRLGTDWIDLYQVHWPSREVPVAEILEALEKLRTQGKIRAIGVSNFGARDLSELLGAGHCETDQMPYGLLWRAIEYETRKVCVQNGVGILCYSPLSQGLLTGKFASADEVPEGRTRTRHFSKYRPQARHGEDGQEAETFEVIESVRRICAELNKPMAQVALAWPLHQPGVTSVLVGARTPAQIMENARAADLELSADILEKLDEATADLKAKLGPNQDMYEGEPRSRIR